MKDDCELTLIEQLQHLLGAGPGTALAMEMRHYITKLGEEGDLNWIDLMVARLTMEGVPLPKVIQELAARAASQRLLGAEKRGGQPTRVMKKHIRHVVHTNAAFLKGALGVDGWKAYVNASNAVGDEVEWAGKASVYYNKRALYANGGQEADLLTTMGAAWAQYAPEQRAALEDYLEKVPKRAPGKPSGEHYPAK